MVGTEELMPHLQEYCLGYLRVQSSAGMIALAHVSHVLAQKNSGIWLLVHGQEADSTSFVIVYSETIVKPGSILLNV